MKYSPEIVQKVSRLYSEGASIYTVSTAVHIGTNAVAQLLRDSSVAIRPGGKARIHTLDERIFESIDTEEKAYWAGFLLADGCVTGKYNQVLKLSLQVRDFPHIVKFRDFLHSTHKIRSDNRACNFEISSKKICADLISLGVTPRKTYTAKPLAIAKPLRRHYFRGLVDGDGSIAVSKNSAAGYSLKLYGTKSVVSDFRRWARTGIMRKHKGCKTWGCLIHTPEDMIPVLHGLYQNSNIFLDRKYERYKDSLRIFYSRPRYKRIGKRQGISLGRQLELPLTF